VHPATRHRANRCDHEGYGAGVLLAQRGPEYDPRGVEGRGIEREAEHCVSGGKTRQEEPAGGGCGGDASPSLRKLLQKQFVFCAPCETACAPASTPFPPNPPLAYACSMRTCSGRGSPPGYRHPVVAARRQKRRHAHRRNCSALGAFSIAHELSAKGREAQCTSAAQKDGEWLGCSRTSAAQKDEEWPSFYAIPP